MRKDDITWLVAIQGFSVWRSEFDKETIQLETRKKKEKFYHSTGKVGEGEFILSPGYCRCI